MLDDDYYFVRRLAVSAFKELGTHDDIPLIKEMLVDDNSDVRSAAISVLKKLVTHDDLPIIKEVLNDSHPDVKTAAFTIFEKFSNDKELKELSEKIVRGEINNDDISFNYLISLDERFYSPKKDVLLLHKKNPGE